MKKIIGLFMLICTFCMMGYSHEISIAHASTVSAATIVAPAIAIRNRKAAARRAREEEKYNQELTRVIEQAKTEKRFRTYPTELIQNLGQDVITIDKHKLVLYDLPNKYYPQIDFSSFQCYMDYRSIKNKNLPSYQLINSDNVYTDKYGFRRHYLSLSDFSVGTDDFLVALGTFYKPKGEVDIRYVVVTDNGIYTIRAADEKSDNHTDSYHMVTSHGLLKNRANIIEFIVDTKHLEPIVRLHGTVTSSSYPELKGRIRYIYRIMK